MLERSPVHKCWTVGDINRLVIPPLFRGQSVISIDAFGRVCGYVSVAFMDDEASEAFRGSTRKLTANDWTNGETTWIIDFIAPNGGVGLLANAMRAALRMVGKDKVFYRRAPKKQLRELNIGGNGHGW